MNRREFLGMAAGAAVVGVTASAKGAEAPKRILFGACRGPKDVPLLKKAGFDFWEWNAASAFMPDELDESKWASRRDEILAAPLPIRSSNGFLPGKFRLTGPQADFAPALDYAERVCRRADKVNLKTIVFGSGGARNVPGDFTAKNRADHPDTEQGTAQMTDFCRQLAKRIADCKVVVRTPNRSSRPVTASSTATSPRRKSAPIPARTTPRRFSRTSPRLSASATRAACPANAAGARKRSSRRTSTSPSPRSRALRPRLKASCNGRVALVATEAARRRFLQRRVALAAAFSLFYFSYFPLFIFIFHISFFTSPRFHERRFFGILFGKDY